MTVKRISGRGKYSTIRFENGRQMKVLRSLILETGLREGYEFDEELFESLAAENDRRLAKETALRIITKTPHSEAGLRRKLRQRGLGEAAIDETVNLLYSLELLDDAAYARLFVDSMLSRRKSRREIEHRLKRESVGEENEAAALARVSDERERENAMALIEKYYPAYVPERTDERIDKLFRYGMRKGFDAPLIRQAINDYEREKGEQE